jgi:hypothetical protein
MDASSEGGKKNVLTQNKLQIHNDVGCDREQLLAFRDHFVGDKKFRNKIQ